MLLSITGVHRLSLHGHLTRAWSRCCFARAPRWLLMQVASASSKHPSIDDTHLQLATPFFALRSACRLYPQYGMILRSWHW